VVVEIMQENTKFIAFIDSLSPLISSFVQNDVFSLENFPHDSFGLIINSFKVKSKDKEISYHDGISKVLATMIFDYFCIGIATLKDNKEAFEKVSSFQRKGGFESSESDIKKFLEELITLIQDNNTKIPFFHNQMLPMKRIIYSLLEDSQISMELLYFFIQNYTQPIFYDQMKTPYYFELGIPWEHKQVFGQVFTPKYVVDFMCEQLISEETSFILDPSAGTGLFLLGALFYYIRRGFSSLKVIIGVEKDPILAMICESAIKIYCKLNSVSTITCKIINDNLFNCGENLTQMINGIEGNGTVLMNPPYTRQELISDTEKTFIKKKMESLPLFNTYKENLYLTQLSGQSSLYVYFIIFISEFLHPLDRVGLIIPNSWMDVKYGEILKSFLIDRYSIHSIISTKREKLIPNVDVNTSIILLQVKDRSTINLSSDSLRRVKFIALNTTDDLTQIEILARNDQVTVTEVPETILSQKSKWGTYLKAPPFYFKLLARLKDKYIQLETIASIKRGFTSGANAFFYLGKPGASNDYFISSYDSSNGNLILSPKNDKVRMELKNQDFTENSSKFIIEREYWMHQVNSSGTLKKSNSVSRKADNTSWVPNYLIKSPKELSSYEIREDDVNYIVLIIPKKEKTQLKAGIQRYILWGERWNPPKGTNYSKRTTCTSRRYWYALGWNDYKNFPIICMMTINDRFTFFYNANNYFFDARLYGIRPRTSTIDVSTLFCYLNSIFVSLQLELLGRVNLGEGGLDVKVYEYNSLKLNILNFQDYHIVKSVQNTFNQILVENPYSITNDKQSRSMSLLEVFLSETKLFSKEDISKMRKSLIEIVQNRLDKARSVSNHNI
jgi:type I restriction-modification system DNA methylase subunit